jgi:hypothetical protein
MNKHPDSSLQYVLAEGICQQLAEAANRKSHRETQKPHRDQAQPQALRGDVYKDTVSLGCGALLRHMLLLLHTKPLRVIATGGSSLRIRVCGALDYVIDRTNHTVWVEPSPLTHRERISKKLPPWHHPFDPRMQDIDLLHPLCKGNWLRYIAVRPGWLSYGPSGCDHTGGEQLFTSAGMMELALAEITKLVWNQLKTNYLVLVLRQQLAATLTLYIGADLISLAMRARLHPRTAYLTARHLNLVWRNQQAFQTIERENPKLLVAVAAWFAYSKKANGSPEGEVLPAMVRDLRDRGLPPKAWRVLASRGIKCLLPLQLNRSPWESMVGTLKALYVSRWPFVPPRGCLGLLFDAAGKPDTFEAAHAGVPGWFWHMACEEAHALKADTNAYRALSDSLPRWAWLARKYRFSPDKNQRRKGIGWLREAAQFFEDVEHNDNSGDAPAWALWLQSASWDTSSRFTVVPLLSPNAVVDEAVALHNCADTYIARCRQGVELLLSLRDRSTGKRIALASARRRGDDWVLDQVAGPCNMQVSVSVRQIAELSVGEVNWQYETYRILQKQGS